MSVVLTLYYLTTSCVQALPISPTEQCTLSSCDDPYNHRTRLDIIWSCLATVFACTWVAVHPNMPEPHHWLKHALCRAEIAVVALLAPEFVIFWAMRQLQMAYKLADKHKGWTTSHGFFAVMGGFMLYQGDEAVHTLEPHKLKDHLESIDITEAEILDKSRGDVISKVFLMGQTGWFVLQCIARHVEHLPLTELELGTLAFATMTFVIYVIWWEKPLNAQQPYPVLRQRVSSGSDGTRTVFCSFKRWICGMHKPTSDSKSPPPPNLARLSSDSESKSHPPLISARPLSDSKSRSPPMSARLSSDSESKSPPPPISARSLSDPTSPEPQLLVGELVTSVMKFLKLHKDMGWDELDPQAKRVPTWYAGMYKDKNEEKDVLLRAGLVGATTATIFGGIHCIAWSFEFPSRMERYLWRVSSLVITCVPFLVFAVFHFCRGKKRWNLLSAVALLGAVLYVLCRAVLIALAFSTLRSLPPGAYLQVRWATFLPHV